MIGPGTPPCHRHFNDMPSFSPNAGTVNVLDDHPELTGDVVKVLSNALTAAQLKVKDLERRLHRDDQVHPPTFTTYALLTLGTTDQRRFSQTNAAFMFDKPSISRSTACTYLFRRSLTSERVLQLGFQPHAFGLLRLGLSRSGVKFLCIRDEYRGREVTMEKTSPHAEHR